MSEESHAMLTTFERALGTLQEALALPVSTVVRDACIQRFEYTYELAWKTIRRFAGEVGLEVNSPASAFRAAFKLGYIEDEPIWVDMKEGRNLTTHTYDEETAEDLYAKLKDYAEAFSQLAARLRALPPPARAGFTLVELLAVIAIIGMLAGIVFGIAGYASKKSDRAKALTDLERIKMALEEYRIENGSYYDGGGASSTDAAFSNAVARYVNGGIRTADPWGREYRYALAGGQGYRLWSTGPNTNAVNPEDDVDSASGSF